MSTEVQERPGEPRQIGRRAVARGAAWSIPVVSLAVAAPAMAASGCTTRTGQLNWTTIGTGSALNRALATTGGTGVTVTITASGDTTAAGNGVVTNTVTGGLHPVIRFTSVNGKRNTAQVITFTFSKPVTNLTFSLLDVDSSPGAYYDQIAFAATGFTANKHSNVIGSGTAAAPFTAKNANSHVDGSSSDGNVDLAWAGPVSAVVFTYSQNGNMDGSPFVGISNLSFQNCS